MDFYHTNLFNLVFYFIVMETNGTKLSLKYSIISGPYGNGWIKTKIDGKPERLPFESMYFKESPKEVLSFLINDYLITKYLDINPTHKHSPRFGDISEDQLFYFKDHLISNSGLSIQNSGLEGVTINNSIYNEINLSFLPKYAIENKKENIKNLIETYLIRTNIISIQIIPKDRTSDNFYEEESTSNYFQDRKKQKDELKERQLEQIIEYAQVVLDKSNLSIKNLEKMVSEKAVIV